MRYRHLGTTGVEVSTQCLGTMMFGAFGNKDHDDCVGIIRHAIDSGINFIDTADVYSDGESEEILAKAMAGRRDELVIATKFFNNFRGEKNRRGGSRYWIRQAVENSLRRLNTDRIDLYQIHRYDWNTDIDETLGALSDLVHEGKILYLGHSSFPADKIVEAQWVAERRGRERFVCEQPQYSIFAREVEHAVLPATLKYGIGVIPWSPLAGGWLAGKYRKGQDPEAGSRYAKGGMFSRMQGEVDTEADPRIDLVERLAGIAEAAGTSLTGLGLGFVGAHPAVTAPIIGPRTMAQLEGLLEVADVVLDADTLDAIDEVCPPGTNAPGVTSSVPNKMLDARNRRR
jgi:aryl-alcohol dehydrogenase-like predicted oxidoreductase